MFNWLKPKKTTKTSPAKEAPAKDRAAIIREAEANARAAREAIGSETLQNLVAMLQQKQMAEEASPATQARKILEKMDKGHVADFLKTLYDEKPTKH